MKTEEGKKIAGEETNEKMEKRKMRTTKKMLQHKCTDRGYTYMHVNNTFIGLKAKIMASYWQFYPLNERQGKRKWTFSF